MKFTFHFEYSLTEEISFWQNLLKHLKKIIYTVCFFFQIIHTHPKNCDNQAAIVLL